MIATHPDLFWGLVASMWVGNCFLVVLNVPLVRYWLSVFKIPYTVLFPAILFFCCIGTYSINNSLDDIYTTAVFGLIGYAVPAPGHGSGAADAGLHPRADAGRELPPRHAAVAAASFSIFVTRPISGTLLSVIGVAGRVAAGVFCAEIAVAHGAG